MNAAYITEGAVDDRGSRALCDVFGSALWRWSYRPWVQVFQGFRFFNVALVAPTSPQLQAVAQKCAARREAIQYILGNIENCNKYGASGKFARIIRVLFEAKKQKARRNCAYSIIAAHELITKTTIRLTSSLWVEG